MVLLLVLPRAWENSKIQLFEINYGKNKWLSLVSSPLPPNILVFIRPTNADTHESPNPKSEQQPAHKPMSHFRTTGLQYYQRIRRKFRLLQCPPPVVTTLENHYCWCQGVMCVSSRSSYHQYCFPKFYISPSVFSSTAPIISYLPLRAQINILTTRVCNPHIFHRQRQ